MKKEISKVTWSKFRALNLTKFLQLTRENKNSERTRGTVPPWGVACHRRCSTVTFSHRTEIKNFTDCAVCVIGRSVMGQMVELPRDRPYGTEGITNRNRTSAATNK